MPLGNDHGSDHVLDGGSAVRIDWPWIVTMDETEWGGAQLPGNCYTAYDVGARPEPRMLVIHWDVSRSSAQCFVTLTKRRASVHFGIDADSTIYQWVDLQHVCWHASTKAANDHSIGVEVCNPYYIKYQDQRAPRPIIRGDTAHGQVLPDHLDFHAGQKAAAAALFAGLARHYGWPLAYPADDGVNSLVADGKWFGAAGHKHAIRSKIDPGNFNPLEWM